MCLSETCRGASALGAGDVQQFVFIYRHLRCVLIHVIFLQGTYTVKVQKPGLFCIFCLLLLNPMKRLQSHFY